MKTKAYIVVAIAFVAFIALFVGCSDLKDTLPPASQTIGVHPEGWPTPTSADFHGTAIRNQGWDMLSCKTCHGGKYDGGTVQVSCLTCHAEAAGPENCSTCHGSSSSIAPPQDLNGNTVNTSPRVGAHQIHLLGTSRSNAFTCAECHSIPSGVYATGHIDGDNRAEVLMNNYAANLTTNSGAVVPSPAYSATTGSCSSTYCHGTFKNGNAANAPVWNVPTSAACGTCHGTTSGGTNQQKALPGGTHPNNLACSTCHGGVINSTGTITNASKHIDGKLNYLGNDIAF